MDASRWNFVQGLFHDAAALPPDARRAFLERATGNDEDLIAEVLDLLARDEAGAALLDRGIAHAAGVLLDPLRAQDDDPAAGPLLHRDFGPYRLTSFLGEGGAGVVYRAERTDIGGEAAVKILRDAALSPARRARFAAEQRTLVRLRHPGIAQLYHADTLADGTPWFAMELVEGATLSGHCDRARASLDERLRLVSLVCDAVQYAHGHAIIHRDLKPSNILVTGDGAVRLLDFGVAKRLDSETADYTRTGLRALTPAYAAPEQSTNDPVGVHTDVYSLGVILFELLTGRLPFEEPGAPAHADPPRPSTVARRADAPLALTRSQWADLDVMVMTAMHVDPDRRYRTVDALRGDIERFRTGRPLVAQRDSRRYRAAKFLRRNRRSVALASAAVLSLLLLTTFFTLRLAAARDVALSQAERAGRIQDFMISLFQGGEAEVLAADSLRVVTLLERGLREAQALDADPAAQSALLATLGGIYRQLGQLPRADSLLHSALDIERTLSTSDSSAVARRLLDIALLRIDQADYAAAETLARDALAMAARALPRDADLQLEALTILGAAQQERGEYDQAVTTLEQALRMHRPADTLSASYAGSLVQLANTRFYAGGYDAADSLNRRALDLYRAQRGARHPLVADVDRNRRAPHADLGFTAPTRAVQPLATIAADRLGILVQRLAVADQVAQRRERGGIALPEAAPRQPHVPIGELFGEIGDRASRRGAVEVIEPLGDRGQGRLQPGEDPAVQRLGFSGRALATGPRRSDIPDSIAGEIGRG